MPKMAPRTCRQLTRVLQCSPMHGFHIHCTYGARTVPVLPQYRDRAIGARTSLVCTTSARMRLRRSPLPRTALIRTSGVWTPASASHPSPRRATSVPPLAPRPIAPLPCQVARCCPKFLPCPLPCPGGLVFNPTCWVGSPYD